MSFSSPKAESASESGFPGCTTPQQDQAILELRTEISTKLQSPGGQYLVKMMGGDENFFCR